MAPITLVATKEIASKMTENRIVPTIPDSTVDSAKLVQQQVGNPPANATAINVAAK